MKPIPGLVLLGCFPASRLVVDRVAVKLFRTSPFDSVAVGIVASFDAGHYRLQQKSK